MRQLLNYVLQHARLHPLNELRPLSLASPMPDKTRRTRPERRSRPSRSFSSWLARIETEQTTSPLPPQDSSPVFSPLLGRITLSRWISTPRKSRVSSTFPATTCSLSWPWYRISRLRSRVGRKASSSVRMREVPSGRQTSSMRLSLNAEIHFATDQSDRPCRSIELGLCIDQPQTEART